MNEEQIRADERKQAAKRIEQLREIIGMQVGSATMCWIPQPTGQFDSVRASGITDLIMRTVVEAARGEQP